jgi:endonuclease/exonuclease/phosphatase family metal-dependent hydrolase
VKGKQRSEPLKVKIKTNGALEAFKQYLLPVSIDKVSEGFLINQNQKTIYFLIETLRDGTTFKVMSYGKGGGIYDMALAAAIVKQHNPDLLLVREMDYLTNRNGKVDQPAVLANLIQMPHYLYLTSITNFDGGGLYGATLYSKYPITKSSSVILPTGDTNTEKGPYGVISVQIGGQTIGFAGTHLNANATRRAAQLPVLIDALNQFTEPLILAGNFNEMPPASNVYTALSGASFNFPCTSCPANTPVAVPTGYSDFIMYKPATKLRVMSHTVGSTSTSAHLPVITEFMLFK